MQEPTTEPTKTPKKNLFGIFNEILPYIAIAISIWAVSLSKEANEISKQMRDDAQRPRLEFVSLSLDPQNVYVYGGRNITWAEKLPLRDDLFEVIEDSFRSGSTVKFAVNEGDIPQEYLLVNLCKEGSPREDIGLILNAVTFTVENQNTDNPINALTIKESYSMINNNEPFPLDMELDNSAISIHENCFSIHLAYACCFNQPSSLNLAGIAAIKASGETEIINLIESPERAGEIIAFADTAYLFSCNAADGQTYEFSMAISRDPSTGNLKDHFISFSRKIFDERAANASERANTNVVVKVNP